MAQEEIARITHYSGKLLPVDRKSPLRYPHKVSEILGAILNILEHRYPNVEATADFRDSTLLPASRADLEQLFGILLGNAFEAVATEGRVRIKVLERGPAHSKPGIYVVIGDTGKGMNAEVKAHLFEPFFSTKATTGLGLGLWMASGIVQQYGGRIRIRSSDSTTHHGTVVSVFLPFQSSSGSKFTSASSSNA
jgi:signal transduction histidine kinase